MSNTTPNPIGASQPGQPVAAQQFPDQQFPNQQFQAQPTPGQQFPPQQFQGQPMPPQQAPKKPIYKRVWFWILVVVALLILSGIINSLGGGSQPDPNADNDAPAAPVAEAPAEQPVEEPAEGVVEESAAEPVAEPVEEPAAASIGDAVTVGDWAITITAVGAPMDTVGNEYLSTEAQGIFVPLSLVAQNNGDEAQTFFASNFVAIDDQGREFEYSTDAAIYSGDSGAALLDEVNPGNSMQGDIFFDIPEGTTLVQVQISNGFFGPPVTVSLQ